MRRVSLIGFVGCALLSGAAWAVDVPVGNVAVATSTQLSPAQAEKQFLEAEQMRGYPAIFRLRELLQQSDVILNAFPQGREGMRVRLVQALLDAFPAESNPERRMAWLDEIEQHVALMQDVRIRAWTGIMLLRRMSAEDASRMAKILSITLDAVRGIGDAYERSYASAAFSEVLMTASVLSQLSEDEIRTRVKDLLVHDIRTSKQRAVVSRLYAKRLLRSHADVLPLLAPEMDKEQAATALLARASDALSQGDFGVAALLALASEPKKKSERDKLLRDIAMRALNDSLLEVALTATRGIADENDQNEQLRDMADQLLKAGEVPWSADVANNIDDGSVAADIWLKIAQNYRDTGYLERMSEAQERAWGSAARITKPAQKAKTYAMLAKRLSSQKSPKHVEEALSLAHAAKEYPQALGAYIKLLAETGKVDDAQRLLKDWPVKSDANKELYEWDEVEKAWTRAQSAIAKALAEKNDVRGALDILKVTLAAVNSDDKDAALRAVVKASLRAGDIEQAQSLQKNIKTPLHSAIALNEIIVALYEKKTPWGALQAQFEQALTSAKKVEITADTSVNDDPMVVMAYRLLASGLLEQTKGLLTQAKHPNTLAGINTALARYFATKGDADEAKRYADKVTNVVLRDAAYAAVSDALVRANHVQEAVKVIALMKGNIARVRAFHSAARTQAYRTDFYGLLRGMQGNSSHTEQLASPGNNMPSPSLIADAKPTANEVAMHERDIIATSKSSSEDYVLKDPVVTAIGKHIPPLDPNVLRVNETRATLAKSLPAARDFRVSMVNYDAPDAQQKFVASLGMAGFSKFQESYIPDVILLESGVADVSSIYLSLRAQGFGDEVMQKHGRVYTLRRPLVVSHGASLVVSNADVTELRLSSERGAYLVNMGSLYIQDVHVTGWVESTSSPQWAGVKDKLKFRPYITSWSMSHSYFGGSIFTALGYSNSKAYGISLSSGPKDLLQFKPNIVARPDGVIAENSFDNVYYGFYSFEADHVALVGNEYKNNVIYGIDPHDRSRYLTIAFNTAWGTEKKHGIIISREVNDTAIIGNLTFQNHGSGFMMDRLSIGTMVYANTGFDNGQDGLTVYESDCKLIASNRFFANQRDGMKVRNSRDIALYYNVLHNNKRAGIEGYSADLKADPAQSHRDFELDPFSKVTAMTMVGNWIERNGVGISAADMAAVFLKGNFFVEQSPKLFRGAWFKGIPEMMGRFDLADKGMVASLRCPNGPILPQHESCKFRKLGFMTSDGQDMLYQRINQKLCGAGL